MRRHSKAGRPKPVKPHHVILRDGRLIKPSHVLVEIVRFLQEFEIFWIIPGDDREPMGKEIEIGSAAAAAKQKAHDYIRGLKLVSVDWDRFKPGEQIFKAAI